MIKKMLGAIVFGAALLLSPVTIDNAAAENNKSNSTTAIAKDCAPTGDLEIAAAYGSFLGNSRLKGVIFNRSLDQDYDNVEVKVDFYDERGSLISSQIIDVREDIERGEAEDISFSLNSPRGTESTKWSIVCAEKDGLF